MRLSTTTLLFWLFGIVFITCRNPFPILWHFRWIALFRLSFAHLSEAKTSQK